MDIPCILDQFSKGTVVIRTCHSLETTSTVVVNLSFRKIVLIEKKLLKLSYNRFFMF